MPIYLSIHKYFCFEEKGLQCNMNFVIIIIIIPFMQGIYTYIPEANYVPGEYSVAGILLLLFLVLICAESIVLLH